MGDVYRQYLRDPRWQKKRLEIMERDGWKCTSCGAEKMTLHVHHRKGYDYQRMPWQYNSEHLQTLCKRCHEALKGTRPGSVKLGFRENGEWYPGWGFDGWCPWCDSHNLKDKGTSWTCLDCGKRIDFGHLSCPEEEDQND